jgi:hypothetical protein
VLPNLLVPYELLQNLAGKHCVAFLLLLAQQKMGFGPIKNINFIHPIVIVSK